MREIKRTKSTKQYDFGDGKFRIVADLKPLHYLKNGKWVDIDVTKGTSEFMGWQRDRYEKNNFKTRLKDKDGSDLTEMACDDGEGGEYWLTIKTAIDKEPVVNVSDIKIERLYEFTADEKIVNPKSTVLLDPRLRAEIRDEGVVFIDDAKKEIIFRILPPKIENDIEVKGIDDFDKKYSNEVHFKLSQQDRYILLEKEITQKGLDWIKKQFEDGIKKISIDDTLILQPDAAAGYDMLQMRSANPTFNYGADPGPHAGNWLGAWDAGAYRARHLIKFNLSSILSGSTIISAIQTLWPWNTGYAGFTTVYANRVLRDWGEGIHTHAPATAGESSWNHYAFPNTWTIAGAADEGTDISATVDITSVVRNANPMNVDVKNAVQEIIDTGVNYGWRLKSEETPSGSQITGYYSSDCAVAAQRPKLVVDFTPPSAPTVISVEPESGDQGETLNVVITGTDFTGATSVSFGAGITVDSFDVDSSTQITANITIDLDAALGFRDVSVTTPVGTGTLSDGFSVTSAPLPPPPPPPEGFWPRRSAVDGYRCFIQQYVKNKIVGCSPWRDPGGTTF